jgi:hypothetical protein
MEKTDCSSIQIGIVTQNFTFLVAWMQLTMIQFIMRILSSGIQN